MLTKIFLSIRAITYHELRGYRKRISRTDVFKLIPELRKTVHLGKGWLQRETTQKKKASEILAHYTAAVLKHAHTHI